MKTILRFLVVALTGLAAYGQIPEYPNDAGKYLSGAGTWAIPSIVSNATVAGQTTITSGLLLGTGSLTAASAGTNYGIDLATTPGATMLVTTNFTLTGLTNNALGAKCVLLLVNQSGANVNVRIPAAVYSSWRTTADLTVDAGGAVTVLTNNTACSLEIFGYGTASTNAAIRFQRYL